jgi:hypothetical protein
MSASGKSLKAQNIGWLWSIVALDAIALLALTFPAAIPEIVNNKYVWMRFLVSAAAPVIVLLLISLIPPDAKAALVFWRFIDILPGHRAFTVHAPKDARIDLNALQTNVGAFPETPREQNSTWYRLYKKVDTDMTVAQAHRHYLLFRDLASLSVLLTLISGIALYALGTPLTAIQAVCEVLVLQYLTTAIAARHNGVRLVTNVLALHAVKKRRS